MKGILWAGALAAWLLLTGCRSTMEDALPAVGMPNPASVWCMEKNGRLDIVQDARGGEVGYCTLPNGERVEEWTLFRRDHQ